MERIYLNNYTDEEIYNLMSRCQNEIKERKNRQRACFASVLQGKLQEIIMENGLEVHICVTYNEDDDEDSREFVIDGFDNITNIEVVVK